MADYSELKRLAEALVSALNEYNSDDCSKHQLDAWSAADDALQNAAGPEVILALIAENERLKKFEDWFVRLETANNSLAESFRAERDQIKTENEALRKAALAAREFIMHEAEVRGLLDENNEVSFRHPRRQAVVAIIDAAMGQGERS